MEQVKYINVRLEIEYDNGETRPVLSSNYNIDKGEDRIQMVKLDTKEETKRLKEFIISQLKQTINSLKRIEVE